MDDRPATRYVFVNRTTVVLLLAAFAGIVLSLIIKYHDQNSNIEFLFKD